MRLWVAPVACGQQAHRGAARGVGLLLLLQAGSFGGMHAFGWARGERRGRAVCMGQLCMVCACGCMGRQPACGASAIAESCAAMCDGDGTGPGCIGAWGAPPCGWAATIARARCMHAWGRVEHRVVAVCSALVPCDASRGSAFAGPACSMRRCVIPVGWAGCFWFWSGWAIILLQRGPDPPPLQESSPRGIMRGQRSVADDRGPGVQEPKLPPPAVAATERVKRLLWVCSHAAGACSCKQEHAQQHWHDSPRRGCPSRCFGSETERGGPHEGRVLMR